MRRILSQDISNKRRKRRKLTTKKEKEGRKKKKTQAIAKNWVCCGYWGNALLDYGTPLVQHTQHSAAGMRKNAVRTLPEPLEGAVVRLLLVLHHLIDGVAGRRLGGQLFLTSPWVKEKLREGKNFLQGWCGPISGFACLKNGPRMAQKWVKSRGGPFFNLLPGVFFGVVFTLGLTRRHLCIVTGGEIWGGPNLSVRNNSQHGG